MVKSRVCAIPYDHIAPYQLISYNWITTFSFGTAYFEFHWQNPIYPPFLLWNISYLINLNYRDSNSKQQPRKIEFLLGRAGKRGSLQSNVTTSTTTSNRFQTVPTKTPRQIVTPLILFPSHISLSHSRILLRTFLTHLIYREDVLLVRYLSAWKAEKPGSKLLRFRNENGGVGRIVNDWIFMACSTGHGHGEALQRELDQWASGCGSVMTLRLAPPLWAWIGSPLLLQVVGVYLCTLKSH